MCELPSHSTKVSGKGGGAVSGISYDCKYLPSTIYVGVSLLNINGAMWVLTVQTNPTNRPATPLYFTTL